MEMSSPDKSWVSVREAVDISGCTDGWVRHLLREGKLDGWKVNEWTWLVSRSGAESLRGTLSTRANANRKPEIKKRKRA